MKTNTILIVIIFLALFAILFTLDKNDSNKVNEAIQLYDLDRKQIDFESYKGKYSVLAFTFISCPSICPMTNNELVRLNERFGDQINLIAINVDPVKDTPEKIEEYMNANNYNWDVLVGDMSNVGRFISDILNYPDADNYVKGPAYHPPGLHLLDKDFKYIEDKNFFPITQDVDDLMLEINKLLELK